MLNSEIIRTESSLSVGLVVGFSSVLLCFVSAACFAASLTHTVDMPAEPRQGAPAYRMTLAPNWHRNNDMPNCFVFWNQASDNKETRLDVYPINYLPAPTISDYKASIRRWVEKGSRTTHRKLYIPLKAGSYSGGMVAIVNDIGTNYTVLALLTRGTSAIDIIAYYPLVKGRHMPWKQREDLISMIESIRINPH